MSDHIAPHQRQHDVAQTPASTLEGTVVDSTGGVVVSSSKEVPRCERSATDVSWPLCSSLAEWLRQFEPRPTSSALSWMRARLHHRTCPRSALRYSPRPLTSTR